MWKRRIAAACLSVLVLNGCERSALKLVPLRAPNPSAPSSGVGLQEVNALRARKGMKPYLPDQGLTKAAYAAACYRAEHLIKGHTKNDFQFLPDGCQADAAGCAAWPPSAGWGSCCIYDRYTYAGAAWCMGRDGKRYMHIFCRK